MCRGTFFTLLLPAHYEALFQQCHQHYQGEGPTGMLLIYPEHVVHIMEGCWELVEAVIRDSCDMMDTSRSVYATLALPPSLLHFLLPPLLRIILYFLLPSVAYWQRQESSTLPQT